MAALETGFGDRLAGSVNPEKPAVGAVLGSWGVGLTDGFSNYERHAVMPYWHNDSNGIHTRQVSPGESPDWMKYRLGVHASPVKAQVAPFAIFVFVTGELCVCKNWRGRCRFP